MDDDATTPILQDMSDAENYESGSSPRHVSADNELQEELTGCAATACCNPSHFVHRFIALIFMCLVGFDGNVLEDEDPNFANRQSLEAKVRRLIDTERDIDQTIPFESKSAAKRKSCLELLNKAINCLDALQYRWSFFHEQTDRYLLKAGSIYLSMMTHYYYLGDMDSTIKYIRAGFDVHLTLCSKSDYYLQMMAAWAIFCAETYKRPGMPFEDGLYFIRLTEYCCQQFLAARPDSPIGCSVANEDEVIRMCPCDGGHEYVHRFHAKDPKTEKRRQRVIIQCYLTSAYMLHTEYLHAANMEWSVAVEYGSMALARWLDVHPEEIVWKHWFRFTGLLVGACCMAGAIEQACYTLAAISYCLERNRDDAELQKEVSDEITQNWVMVAVFLMTEELNRNWKLADAGPWQNRSDFLYPVKSLDPIPTRHFRFSAEPLRSLKRLNELIVQVKSWLSDRSVEIDEGLQELFESGVRFYEEKRKEEPKTAKKQGRKAGKKNRR